MFESSVTYRDVSLKFSSFQTLHGLRTEEELNEEYMGNDKEGKASDSKRGEGRKRLRDGGSQTDE